MRHIRSWVLVAVMPVIAWEMVGARRNEKHSMHKICYESREGNFLSNVPRTVDGVVLGSRDERDEDCVITFQTESVIEKFLLKFERLQMDCNDHLYIYDGAHVAGHWRAHISCQSKPSSVGSKGFIITRSNFVTLRYHTDSWGTTSNGFTLIITAFKNLQTFGCSTGFPCDSFICISQDLACDNVSHCGHGQDEIAHNNCSGDGVHDLLGLDVGQLVGGVLLILLLLGAGGAAAWIRACRQDSKSAGYLWSSQDGNKSWNPNPSQEKQIPSKASISKRPCTEALHADTMSGRIRYSTNTGDSKEDEWFV